MTEPYRESEVLTLGPNKKHCHACANILDVRAEICPRCGIRQLMANTAVVVQESRNKLVAGLFALGLGGLGIHKFYLGDTKAGVIYLGSAGRGSRCFSDSSNPSSC